MLLYVNIGVALVAVVLMLLVLRGIVGHFLARHDDGSVKGFWSMTANELIRFGVGMYHIKGLFRMGIWDLAVPITFIMTSPIYERAAYVSVINIILALLAIVGSIATLLAFYANIPDEERGNYHWMLSGWYPQPAPRFLLKKD